MTLSSRVLAISFLSPCWPPGSQNKDCEELPKCHNLLSHPFLSLCMCMFWCSLMFASCFNFRACSLVRENHWCALPMYERAVIVGCKTYSALLVWIK